MVISSYAKLDIEKSILTLGNEQVGESVVNIPMIKFKPAKRHMLVLQPEHSNNLVDGQKQNTRVRFESVEPDTEEEIFTTDEENSDYSETSDYDEKGDLDESDF